MSPFWPDPLVSAFSVPANREFRIPVLNSSLIGRFILHCTHRDIYALPDHTLYTLKCFLFSFLSAFLLYSLPFAYTLSFFTLFHVHFVLVFTRTETEFKTLSYLCRQCLPGEVSAPGEAPHGDIASAAPVVGQGVRINLTVPLTHHFVKKKELLSKKVKKVVGNPA